jgi:transcriptional regulator with XRE-family HTH domain
MPRKPPPDGHVLYTLGSLIAERRCARGLTQLDLANLIGVSHSSVMQYERGMHEPPMERLIRIAHACTMSLSAFLSPLDRVKLPPLEHVEILSKNVKRGRRCPGA